MLFPHKKVAKKYNLLQKKVSLFIPLKAERVSVTRMDIKAIINGTIGKSLETVIGSFNRNGILYSLMSFCFDSNECQMCVMCVMCDSTLLLD